MSKGKGQLALRERRIFSEEMKKRIVKDLVSKRTTMRQVVAEHQVNRNSVYKWLYKYSPQHQPKPTLVVQMQSEETKNHELRQRLAELERIVGQKQLEIDFLNKLMELGSQQLGFDLKKSFSQPPLNGTEATGKNTAGR
jgi:transposase-like protein